MQAAKAKSRRISLGRLSTLAQRTLDTLRWLEDMYDALSAISVLDSGAQPKEIFYEVFGVLMRSAPGYIVYPEFSVVYLESGSVNIESPSGVVFYDDPDEDAAYTKLPPAELERILADVAHGLFTFLVFALEHVPDDQNYQHLRREIVEKLEELAAAGAVLDPNLLEAYRRVYDMTRARHLRVEVPEVPTCGGSKFDHHFTFPEPGAPGTKVIVEGSCWEGGSAVFVAVVFPYESWGSTRTAVHIRTDALTKTASVTLATDADSDLRYNPKLGLGEYVKAIEEAHTRWKGYALRALEEALQRAHTQEERSVLEMALNIARSLPEGW